MLTKTEFYEIFKTSPAASLVVLADSPRYTIVEVNKAYYKSTNTEKSDLIGKGIFEAFPENPSEHDGTGVYNLAASLEKVIAGKKPHEMKMQKYDIPVRGTREFEVRYWNATNTPILNEKGNVSLILHTVADETAKVLSEQKEKASRIALKKSQDQYRSLFYQNPLAVYSFDLNGSFVSANESAARLAECSVDQLLKTKFESLIAPEHHRKVIFHSEKAMRGEAQNFIADIITTKGSRRVTNMTILPIIVNGKVAGVYGISMDITRRLKIEKQIKESLHEKNVLLTEVHHRVKNNLAIISSLLTMQADSTTDKKLQGLLRISESRIRSMGMIHELLYNQEDFAKIAFGTYINKLLEHISTNHQFSEASVTTEVNADNIFLDINTAIPCALILNELITNAYKHAFLNKKSGQIQINIDRFDNTFTLVFSDDGKGFSGHINESEVSTLGMSLIHGLVRQIGGTIHIESNDNGSVFTINFSCDSLKLTDDHHP